MSTEQREVDIYQQIRILKKRLDIVEKALQDLSDICGKYAEKIIKGVK